MFCQDVGVIFFEKGQILCKGKRRENHSYCKESMSITSGTEDGCNDEETIMLRMKRESFPDF